LSYSWERIKVFIRNARSAIKAAILCVGIATCTVAAAADQLVPLHVRLDWSTWGLHAPFFLAQQKGWFKAQGLDVHIDDGNGSIGTVQIVASGDEYDVGLATSAAVMIGREKGLPAKIVAELAGRNELGLIVPSGSSTKDVASMKGRAIAFTGSSMEAPFIDSFLAASGLKRSDVQLMNMDAAAKNTAYVVSRVDGVFSPVPSVMPLLTGKRPSKAFLFSDYGLSMPSFCLFVKDDDVAKEHDALVKFSSVIASTWAYIYNGHEAEAADAMIAGRPHAHLDRKVLMGQIDGLKQFIVPAAGDSRPLGVPSELDYAAAIKTLSRVHLLSANHQATEFFAPGFVQPTVDKVAKQ